MKVVLAAAIFIATVMVGCLSQHGSYVAAVESPWDGWVSVIFDNADTAGAYDLKIILRYDDTFPADSLPMQISAITPTGEVFRERFVFTACRRHNATPLANETAMSYRDNVVFARHGRYRIAFKPEQPVSGIEAIGINIEKRE